jgi:flagellar biosynthesis GTPase FlhF
MHTAQVVIEIDLAREAKEINALHAKYSAAQKTTLDMAVEIGKHLIAVKDALKHGEFMAWVEKNCEFGDSMARKYMATVKSVTVTDLPDSREPQTVEKPKPTTIRDAAAAGAKKRNPKPQPVAEPVTAPWHAAVPLHLGYRPKFYCHNGAGPEARAEISAELGYALPARLVPGSPECDAVARAIERCVARRYPSDSQVIKAAQRKNAEVAAEVETLPETIQQRIDRLATKKVEAETAALRAKFWDEVSAKVEEQIGKREEQLLKREESLRVRARHLDDWMTEEEFKLVLSCLHSDKHPENQRAKYDKAFVIINRLKEYLSVDVKTLRGHGWNKS